MSGGFTKICHNNPKFSYNQTQITGSQLENVHKIMIIVYDDWSLQLRQSLVCEIRAKVEVKVEYLNTKTGTTHTLSSLL